jgi:hypothetical protein
MVVLLHLAASLGAVSTVGASLTSLLGNTATAQSCETGTKTSISTSAALLWWWLLLILHLWGRSLLIVLSWWWSLLVSSVLPWLLVGLEIVNT